MRLQAREAGILAQTQSGYHPFRLHRPRDADELADVLLAYPSATVAAGCSDLVARLREGERIERLISLRLVSGLDEIVVDRSGALHLGALVTHHRGSTSPVVAQTIPRLARAWGEIATVRIRYTATLGGNLMAGRHRYEMPLMMTALGAHHHYDSSGRVLLGIEVPTADLVCFGYERSMRPTTTVAVAVRRSGDTLAIRAVVGSEYRPGYLLELALVADSLAASDIPATAQQLAQQLPDECGDYNGSVQYRRHLVAVLLTRLLREISTTGSPQNEEIRR